MQFIVIKEGEESAHKDLICDDFWERQWTEEAV